MSNVYHNPKDFNLSIVESLFEASEWNEYNKLIVWQHIPSGRIFYAKDSGEYWPVPFEQFRFESFESGISTNLTEICFSSYDRFAEEVNDFPVSVKNRSECLSKVRELLLKRGSTTY